MEVLTLNMRSDVLDQEKFRREFGEIWDAVIREQLSHPGGPAISPEFVAAVRGKPGKEVVRFRFAGAGLTGFEHVIITHVLAPALHAGVTFVITEVLKRMRAGRPPDALTTADTPAEPQHKTEK